MSNSRRRFLNKSILGTSGLLLGISAGTTSCNATNPEKKKHSDSSANDFPVIISTWISGIAANEAAWQTLQSGGTSLDAVEKGVMVAEADPENTSVGYGAAPDRDGHITLDASIMDWQGNAGSVCFLENIKHPISVARKVMEKTPHVMLVGEGAQQFALSEGFKKEDLHTERSLREWEKWKVKSKYEPVINVENHDTIGMLAIDKEGRISGSCTTSGLAYKMRGRVGDSPIIGAGLYVDNEVGGAVSTGLGEAVLRTCGSFLVVELMRQGKSPQEACEEAIRRVVKWHKNFKDFQVCFLAVNKSGEHGAFAIQPGFNFALHQQGENRMIDAPAFIAK